jgi:Rrf2 family transcriptional regulator, iron-sulfur cluster assembly transcription factor
MLSRACGYAVRTAVFLAKDGHAEYIPVHEMSEVLGISHSFLSKIVRELARSGILVSHRGPNGGVALAQSAKDICVKDVVLAIDGPDLFTCCVLGLPGCGIEKPCPLHREWSQMRGEIEFSFSGMTLADLSRRGDGDHENAAGDGRADGSIDEIDRYIVPSSSRLI